MTRFSIPVLLIMGCWVIFSSDTTAADALSLEERYKSIEKRLDLMDADHLEQKQEVEGVQTTNEELKKLAKKLKAKLERNNELQEDLMTKVKELQTKVEQQEAKILSSLLLEYVPQAPKDVSTAPYSAGNNVRTGMSKIPRTCAERRIMDYSIPSGMQWIDPDGENVGENPIYVFCDMTSGSTLIPHDSESSLSVSQCAEPGCYSHFVNYKAHMRQIKALAELSSECSQSIKYDCFNAPFKYYNTVYAWWNDRDGNPQYFWAGNNAGGVHTCQCGIDGNCADSAVMCNCDTLKPTLLVDDGVITNKYLLPVTSLHFGPTQLNSYGIHKLGKFKCSGYSRYPGQSTTGRPKKQVNEAFTGMPTSCGDLKKIGHTLSGFFSIKGDKMLKSVYCNFTELPDDDNFEKLIGDIDVKSSPTYFYVQRENSCAAAHTPIPFHYALVNVGNAMHLASGKFKAPVKGTFFFSFTGLAYSPDLLSYGLQDHVGLQVALYLNGGRIGSGPVQNSNANAHQWKPVTLQSTLDLNKGDQVWVQISYISPGTFLYDDSFHHTHFTGFLLEEDIVASFKTI